VERNGWLTPQKAAGEGLTWKVKQPRDGRAAGALEGPRMDESWECRSVERIRWSAPGRSTDGEGSWQGIFETIKIVLTVHYVGGTWRSRRMAVHRRRPLPLTVSRRKPRGFGAADPSVIGHPGNWVGWISAIRPGLCSPYGLTDRVCTRLWVGCA